MATRLECLRLTFLKIHAFWLIAFAILFTDHNSSSAESSNKVNKTIPAWTGRELAIIVNDNDSLSIQIADYYQNQRHIPASQIIHIRLTTNSKVLSRSAFEVVKQKIDRLMPNHVQGYLLTWLTPYRVECMSITTAFATGFDPAFCAQGCRETRHNPYYDSTSDKPFADFGWRPAMVLAGKTFAAAKLLIDRGIASDFSNPGGSAYLLKTSDTARSSRANNFSAIAAKFKERFNTIYLKQDFIEDRNDVMFYFTGLTKVPKLASNRFLPGAIADHLTSAGGMLTGSDQMSIMAWLNAGATGSYGAVIEPCNFPAKFPNPELVMHHYLTGKTLIEAYWKSVAEPGQGIFVGEPLAKPFARHGDKVN